MTGEDWNTVMNDGIVASGGPHNIWGILSSLYFVSLVILGNCILNILYKSICMGNHINSSAIFYTVMFFLLLLYLINILRTL